MKISKNFLLLILVLGVTLIFSGCAKKTDLTPDKVKADTKKDQVKIQVPFDLVQCNGKYFKPETNGKLKDCSKFTPETVCSYYKSVKDGQESTLLLEYTNACNACRFYGEAGSKKVGDTEYIHLGYYLGKCSQGQYQDKK